MPRFLITYKLDVPQFATFEIEMPTESLARERAERMLDDERFRTTALTFQDGDTDLDDPITVDSVDVIEED